MSIARVALDVPVADLFDYEHAGLAVTPGQLVVVPFGRGRQVGVVMEVASRSALPAARLRRIDRVLPIEPLPAATLDLIRFCSDYYHHPVGQVALGALPTALRRTTYTGFRTSSRYRLTAAGRSLPPEHFPKRATAMRRLLDALRSEEVLDDSQARQVVPRATALLQAWISAGWVELAEGDSPATSAASTAPALTEEQQQAVDNIVPGFGHFGCWLLEGVTGSGKTEVYFRLVEHALANGQQSLLLVPEINLTPQLEARFAERFPGVPIASLHSGLAEGERCQRWLEARTGQARVVIGTRLSVFTPLPRLGLVIVDEEHDASFKQQDGVRYSARDIAVYLGSQLQVPVVLGSATPSLESYHNARSGRFKVLRLTRRPAASPPSVRLIDTRDPLPPHGLTHTVLEAIGTRVRQGEQSLVFLNRRGYAPAFMCAACGWAAGCSRCSARVVWHLQARCLRCHHCGHEMRLPQACPDCGNQDLRGLGQGTQRLEQALVERFPDARVLRIDRDSTQRKNAWQSMREQIHGDRADILVGTQMLAKGHDFPKLTLVAIVQPDAALYSSEFRAAERLFQQLMQVSGRAGRADRPGEVLVQTRFPDHPLYRALVAQDYRGYADALLEERRQSGFPPFVFQAVLRAEAHDPNQAQAFLDQAARLAASPPPEVTLYDPVPAALARVAGRHRWQLLVQSTSRASLQRFLAEWRPGIMAIRPGRARWSLDVDPVEL